MEKYFKVTKDSSLCNDYWSFVKNKKVINELVIEFIKKHHIETHSYGTSNDKFYIQPTNVDIQNFDSVLNKPIENGLRSFKKNSVIGKDWLKSLNEKGLTVKRKPMVPMYFDNIYGHFHSRLFDTDGIVYCSIEGEFSELDTPKGFEEMKASEFFKIVEEIEKKEGK